VCSPADRTSAWVGALDAHRQRGPQRRPFDRMLQTAEKVYKYLTWAYDRLTIARLGARTAGRGEQCHWTCRSDVGRGGPRESPEFQVSSAPRARAFDSTVGNRSARFATSELDPDRRLQRL
jgi:hypothetical protein